MEVERKIVRLRALGTSWHTIPTTRRSVLQWSEAVRWYRLAADQGHAGAQQNLGVTYSDGRGVSKNDTEAVRWYRLAADQEHSDAPTWSW